MLPHTSTSRSMQTADLYINLAPLLDSLVSVDLYTQPLRHSGTLIIGSQAWLRPGRKDLRTTSTASLPAQGLSFRPPRIGLIIA